MDQLACDQILIQAVEKQDSTALETLFRRYIPMVYTVINQYYLKGYEQEDWLQEARIVCYETCLCYQKTKVTSFGCFYKLRLKHHCTSLLRKELAQKRIGNQQAILYDELPDNWLVAEETMQHYQVTQDLTDYLQILSTFELVCFRILLGDITIEAVCQQLNCERLQVERALYRCQSKFKQFRK